MYAMSARSVRLNQNKRFARNFSVSQLQIPEKCVILEMGVNPCILNLKQNFTMFSQRKELHHRL